ncbi:MAG: hypothetical protein AAF939_08940, partial [Planctomycetota bacterium]
MSARFEATENPATHGELELGYQVLESRQVLSATFTFIGAEVFLDGFDANQDLTISQENVLIGGMVQDAYVFELENGSWSGPPPNSLVEIENAGGGLNNQLEIATAFFGNANQALIRLDGTDSSGGNIQLFQNSGPITADEISIENMTNVDQSLELNLNSDVEISNLSVIDSNPNDASVPAADLAIDTTGGISVTGSIQNELLNTASGIILTASLGDSDLTIDGNIETARGDIELVAADSILVSGNSLLQASMEGDLSLAAGVDGVAGNQGDVISLDDGSSLVTQSGTIRLNTSAGNDIFVSEIISSSAGNSIRIESGGGIFDNSANESVNLSAVNGRIILDAQGSLGGVGIADLDIDAQLIRFQTPDATFIEDTADGIEIDGPSSSFGGVSFRSSHFLTLSSTVNLGSDSFFFAGNSSQIHDDILITGNVFLNSNTDAIVRFIAGDDIVIDGGLVRTSGTANHQIDLVADAENNIDLDRGSITNTAGIASSLITNDLRLSAFDGIGDSDSTGTVNQPLRVSVDQLTANNLEANDIRISEQNAIQLTQVFNADGAILVTAAGNINAVDVVTSELESSEDNADSVQLVSTFGQIDLQNVISADGFLVRAENGNIVDLSTSNLQIRGDANFESSNQIRLGDQASDQIYVAANARFQGIEVRVGQDGGLAGEVGGADVRFGSTTFDVSEKVTITEDDSMTLAGSSQADEVYLAAVDSIVNQDSTRLEVGQHAQFFADEVNLGGKRNDFFDLDRVGIVADEVYLATNSNTELDGREPILNPSVFGSPVSQGTLVTTHFFMESTGSVFQSLGHLNISQLGIRSAGAVELANVAATNSALALEAGASSTVSDSALAMTLQSLANVDASEVRVLPQAIAVNHLGELNVTSVGTQLTVDQPLGDLNLVGFQTLDGSILAVADGTIQVNEDIAANGMASDPQVTVYSRTGDGSNPGIELDADLVVRGPGNIGLVTSVQTFAQFFDDQGFVFDGTTKVLVLNPDGSANQDIVLTYGHAGETGYRVGVVWDDQNQSGNPVELINTYVADPTVMTEAFDDAIYVQNPGVLLQIDGNEGGFETISKVGPYSKENIIAHNDTPNVFSTVTVRNDQDINLFSGDIVSVTNQLNETSQVILAELDSPKRFAPDLPTINQINPVEVKTFEFVPLSSTTPDQDNSFEFTRDTQPFESGELRWVLVTIPMDEIEEISGELRLVNPSRFYAADPVSDVFNLPDVGENEVEKIIREIESNPNAEPGFWYRIFKDYRNRDDELFFYHFKT